MSFLANILSGMLKNMLVSAVKWVFDFFKTRSRYKKIQESNDKQAVEVQSVADEIKKLLSDGKEVPQELKDKLRAESKDLISGTFDNK